MTQQSSPNELVTAREAARILNVDLSTLWRWREKGVGPTFIRIGGRTIRYRLSELTKGTPTVMQGQAQ